MEIILMRHGKPGCISFAKVTSREMADWVAKYNLSDTGSDKPPESSKLMATSALKIVSSPLPRALSSLKALGRQPDIIDEVFMEAELPLVRVPGFRLSPLYWAAFFRVMWLCGISRNVEGPGMAKAGRKWAPDHGASL